MPLLAVGCSPGGRAPADAAATQERPSILLVTLDTTRADAVGPGAAHVTTPALDALASRGRLYRHAYATAPETLPSHASFFTGLYPAGHGVHENGRALGAAHPLLAERLRQHGYATAAFVSSFVLARRFGLARGFETYDDGLGDGAAERRAADTTDRALAFLKRAATGPVFVWVHYFDPHAPYEPPEPFRTRYAARPYHGEVAAMDEQIGRLLQAFDARGGAGAVLVVGDHGEGLGEHGEARHGHLLYQSTMRVPLIVSAPGLDPGVVTEPVSTRRVFHTILDVAGVSRDGSLRDPGGEVVLGEAMKPYLEYGWQPQTMAVHGGTKAILAGRLEAYDLAADPSEARNLGSGAELPGGMRRALEEYPIPPLAPAPAEPLSDEARQRLASLGYVSATAAPVVRRNAPRPADMVHLIETIERASDLFVAERYADVVPLLERILAQDPDNLDATLRLAAAHSAMGRNEPALRAFRRAAALAPASPDVRLYFALHQARGPGWPHAAPVLEALVAESPDRLPALEGLARVRERQGRIAEAVALHQRIHLLRPPRPRELVALGQLAMQAQQTPAAIDAFERARAADGDRFAHDLELGVLYLAARRLDEARTALDRVPPSHPGYAMALFKRAQVSVLLNEPDTAARIARARRHATAETRDLIAGERLFMGR